MRNARRRFFDRSTLKVSIIHLGVVLAVVGPATQLVCVFEQNGGGEGKDSVEEVRLVLKSIFSPSESETQSSERQEKKKRSDPPVQSEVLGDAVVPISVPFIRMVEEDLRSCESPFAGSAALPAGRLVFEFSPTYSNPLPQADSSQVRYIFLPAGPARAPPLA